MPVRARRPRAPRALAATIATVAVVTLVGGCGADASDDADPEHRTFALAGKTLTVDSDDSAVELVPAGKGAEGVRVTRWFDARTALGGDPEVTWTMDGNRLTLRMNCSGVITDCSAKHRVEVPRGVAVTVENGDGEVTARGFRDTLKVHTEDGSVSVKDSRGPLELRSEDGSVTVEDSAGPLDVQSEDGSVTAQGITSRRVTVGSRDGAVRLALAAVPDRVDARTQDGSLDIAVPGKEGGEAASYQVEVESGDGATDISVPRDGNSPHHLSARSEDGEVTVRSAN
ncbi:DUF4097 family beta strand repeat-containing protein [Streptomyces sp. NPDC003006]